MARTISAWIVCSAIPLLLLVWGVVLFIMDKRRRGLHTVTVCISKGVKVFAVIIFFILYSLLILSATLPKRTDYMIISMVFSGLFTLAFGIGVLDGFFAYTDIGKNGLTSVSIFCKNKFTAYNRISFFYIGGYSPSIHYIGNNVIYYCYDKYGRHICSVEASLKSVARFTNKMQEYDIPLTPISPELENTPEYKQYIKLENRKFCVFAIAFMEAILIVLLGVILGTAL